MRLFFAFVVAVACAGCANHSANRDQTRYRCVGGATFNVVFDSSARTALLRLDNAETIVLPRVPGGPAERYSDGSMTLTRNEKDVELLRNEQTLLKGCQANR